MRREKLAHARAAADKQAAQRAHIQKFVDRFRYKATKAKQAQSRIKMLERMEPIAIDEAGAGAPFRFPEPAQLSPPLLALDRAAVGYGGPPILKDLSLRLDPDDRIALLGANGRASRRWPS
jgi:ATP-binding cassette subfamily F protein 3